MCFPGASPSSLSSFTLPGGRPAGPGPLFFPPRLSLNHSPASLEPVASLLPSQILAAPPRPARLGRPGLFPFVLRPLGAFINLPWPAGLPAGRPTSAVCGPALCCAVLRAVPEQGPVRWAASNKVGSMEAIPPAPPHHSPCRPRTFPLISSPGDNCPIGGERPRQAGPRPGGGISWTPTPPHLARPPSERDSTNFPHFH